MFRSVESGISEWKLAISGVSRCWNRYSWKIADPRNNRSSALETPPMTEREAHIACTKGRKIALTCDCYPVTGEVYRSSEEHFAAAAIILNEEDDASPFLENRFAPSSMLAPDSPGSRGSGGSN